MVVRRRLSLRPSVVSRLSPSAVRLLQTGSTQDSDEEGALWPGLLQAGVVVQWLAEPPRRQDSDVEGWLIRLVPKVKGTRGTPSVLSVCFPVISRVRGPPKCRDKVLLGQFVTSPSVERHRAVAQLLRTV